MIIIKNLSYGSPHRERLFDDISVTFADKKTGLVGRNGSGKTTLLWLIMGKILPESGRVKTDTPLAYMPQDYQLDSKATVGETLGIGSKLEAIRKLNEETAEGSAALLEIIGDDWDIESRAKTALAKMGLQGTDLNRKISSLSGGERMQVLLARLLIQNAGFLLLDEPTNNLDTEAKEMVCDFIRDWRRGIIVISHDRELLMLMEEIVEISEGKLRAYGGNYEDYCLQKNTEREALKRRLVSARQELDKDRKEAAAVKERQERRSSRGKDKRMKFGLRRGPKGMFDKMESQADITSGKLNTRHEENVREAQERLEELKARLPQENRIHIDLSRSCIPNGKTVAEFRKVAFSYPTGKRLLDQMSFSIIGPERIAITGPNGSGKTTLVRLLLGELRPDKGKIYFPIRHHAYLDQHLGFMQPDKTLIENLREMSGQSEAEAHDYLARFLFAEDSVFKRFGTLSGGERIRAALACVLARRETPELLILDEPTNNLDLDSLERLESALMNFQGALIVISHDRTFLENIGVTRRITF